MLYQKHICCAALHVQTRPRNLNINMKAFLFLFLTAFNLVAKGQIRLNDLLDLKFGTSSRDSIYIYEFLSKYNNGLKDYEIMCSDFMNACEVTIENYPYENLGSCDSHLLFWKDSLTAAKFTFMFPPKELYKFKPFISQLLKSLNTNKELLKADNNQETNIDANKIGYVANTECKEGMFPNNKLLGRNMWSFKTSPDKSDGFIIADISITSGFRRFKKDVFSVDYDEKYQGAWMEVNFVVLNESSIDRFNDMNDLGLGSIGLHTVQKQFDGQIIDFNGSGYGIKRTRSNAINLKEKNQVYYLPVELNGGLYFRFCIGSWSSGCLHFSRCNYDTQKIRYT